MIKDIHNELAEVAQTNKDRVSHLAAYIAVNDTLQSENAELRKMLNKTPNQSSNNGDKHLVIVDAAVNIVAHNAIMHQNVISNQNKGQN